MNMKQIEGFCYLAQTLNFSKAAEMLYITQPAFSRMIVNLEEELGCQLFVRSKVKPRLTLAGERIYKHMKTMVRDYEDICNIAKMAGTDQLGHLRIGILDNGLTVKSKEILTRYAENNPLIKIEVKEYSEVEIFHALEMEWIDVAFVAHFPDTFKSNHDGVVWEHSRECIAVNKHHTLAEKSEINISELKDVPFIMVRENKSEMGYNRIMTECLKHGFAPNIVMKADSISSALACVDCNLGCTMITETLKHLAGDNVVLVPLANSKLCEHWLIWSKATQNKQVENFVSYV